MKIALINWAVLMCQPLVVKELVVAQGGSDARTHAGHDAAQRSRPRPVLTPCRFLKAGGAK